MDEESTTLEAELTSFDDQETGIAPQAGPQTILLACDAEEIFFGGALNAGKSYALGLDLQNQHQKYGGKVSGIVFRQSVPELDDLIKKFKEILEPFGWEYLVGKKTFKHESGAECRMRHLEDANDVRKYWGHEYTWMGVDEYGDFPEASFEAIQKLRAARLRSAHGVKIKFVATGNPCGVGHKFCKERYIDPSPAFVPYQDPRSKHHVVYIPGRMENNIAMMLNDPDYRERCKSMGPSWYVEALINGDWSRSPEGNMFHRDWFNNRFDLLHPPNFLYKIASWDTAFKTTKDSARSACTVWGITENAFYLLMAWAEKVEFPALNRKVKDVHFAWGLNETWVEDKASGPTLIQSMREDTEIAVKGIKVDGDKQRRAFAVTPYFESAKVFLPYSAPWVDSYIEEMCAFPAPTGFKDQVDSTSQGLTELAKVKRRMERFRKGKVVALKGSIYSI